MNLRTFSAPTMAEALGQVKKEMGFDALILHTRTYRRRHWLGLRRREIVEITAGNAPPQRVSRRAGSPNGAPNVLSNAISNALSNGPSTAASRTPANGGFTPAYGPGSLPPVYAQNSRPSCAQPYGQASGAQSLRSQAILPSGSSATSAVPATVVDSRRTLLETPAANGAIMLNFTQEVTALKSMVMDLVTQTRMNQAPSVPEDLFEYYLQLIENEVAEEVAAEVIKQLRNQLRPEQLKQDQCVRERLAEQLEKMIPVTGPIVRHKTIGPHIVALIGPTGVGKTTTLAKLAANLKLRENHSVGLITIDTYRIAAVDQLRKYADIIGSPLRVVMTPEELREAVAEMSDCEFILIDTAGRSPTDTLKLNELKNFLAAANPDEVHLVVSTTQSQQCIERAIDRFGSVRVDKVIFTKFDEAVHIGVVLNVVKKLNKGLSYVTTGQNVPDDIEVGRGRRLAQRLLGVDLMHESGS